MSPKSNQKSKIKNQKSQLKILINKDFTQLYVA